MTSTSSGFPTTSCSPNVRHVVVDGAEWRDAPRRVGDAEIVAFTDAAPAVLFGAVAHRFAVDKILWLTITTEYVASIAARDIKTLSTLGGLRGCVLSATHPTATAALIHALVSADDVTITNQAGSLEHAFNRPLVTRPLELWTTLSAPYAASVTLSNFATGTEVVSTRL